MSQALRPFVFNSNPGRIIFGRGKRAELHDEIERLGCQRAMLIASPQQEELLNQVGSDIGELSACIYPKAAMHTPTSVTENALKYLEGHACDVLVAVGGGSAIGLSKALALRTDLPQIAVPTTYAGSEMTSILGETEGGRKTTLRSAKVLPEVVIYDVDLTLSLPGSVSGTSGLNAVAHAVEALYAHDANPVTSLMAGEAVGALAHALPAVIREPNNLDARAEAQYGAWLAASCLGAVGMALHHKICHVLGGTFGLPHAETHAVMLPHVCRYNEQAAPEAMRRIAVALGCASAVDGLFELCVSVGAPAALRDLGMPKPGIDEAVDLVMTNQYLNPRRLDADPLREMLSRAWAGER